jgi:hypothetical protein
MKVVLIPAFLLLVNIAASRAEEPPAQGMVGVLMDASCPTIAVDSRHSESADVVAAAREIKRRKTPARDGMRGRTLAAKTSDSGDRYDNCKARASTTEFAIHTDGQLFLLDEDGNQVVRQQMRNDSFRASLSDDSGAPRWLTVMVEARKNGDRLTITSLRR